MASSSVLAVKKHLVIVLFTHKLYFKDNLTSLFHRVVDEAKLVGPTERENLSFCECVITWIHVWV